jgi:hypothetical protein
MVAVGLGGFPILVALRLLSIPLLVQTLVSWFPSHPYSWHRWQPYQNTLTNLFSANVVIQRIADRPLGISNPTSGIAVSQFRIGLW